jgi:hypothetical protein
VKLFCFGGKRVEAPSEVGFEEVNVDKLNYF